MAVYLDAVAEYDLKKVRESVEQGMTRLGISFSGAKSAVIKPNMVQAFAPDTGVISHPVVIEAIVDTLLESGVTEIAIAEAPALGIDTQKAFNAAGYTEVAKRKGVKLVDLFEAPRTPVHIGYGYKDVPNVYDEEELQSYYCGYLQIPTIILESDLYINVGKLKTHNRTTITLGMKNQWGLLSFKDRQMYHRIGLYEPIVQLARAVKPDLVVIDGIVGMEGNGPILGTPKPVGAMLMGVDMVEVEIAGSILMGQDPREVRHLSRAVELGLGSWDVDVLGERVENLAKTFDPAPQDVKKNHNFYLWRNHRACHLDDEAFYAALKLAKKTPKYWMFIPKLAYYVLFKRLDVVRGRRAKMPEFKKGQKIIISGECARDLVQNYEELPQNVIHIPGCPPNPEDIVKAIIRM